MVWHHTYLQSTWRTVSLLHSFPRIPSQILEDWWMTQLLQDKESILFLISCASMFWQLTWQQIVSHEYCRYYPCSSSWLDGFHLLFRILLLLIFQVLLARTCHKDHSHIHDIFWMLSFHWVVLDFLCLWSSFYINHIGMFYNVSFHSPKQFLCW